MGSFDKDQRDTLEFSNQDRTVCRTQSIGYDTCYGCSWMNPQNSKVHTYKIRVDKVDQYLWIGISNKDTFQKSCGASSIGNGAICCDKPKASWYKTNSSGTEKLDFVISSEDVITLIINFTNKSLTYQVNNQVKCKDSITAIPYKLAATIGERAQVTILEYRAEPAQDDIKQNESNQLKVWLFI